MFSGRGDPFAEQAIGSPETGELLIAPTKMTGLTLRILLPGGSDQHIDYTAAWPRSGKFQAVSMVFNSE